MKRILLLILAVIVLLVGALLVAGMFAPKNQSVKKSILIDAPAFATFVHLKYFDKSAKWSPWLSKDPNVALSTEGTDGLVGAKRFWKSTNDEAGSGVDVITGIEENKYIASNIEFYTPREGKGKNRFELTEAQGKTRVTWSFDYEIPYPWNAFSLFSKGESPMDKTFSQGLVNLKNTLEKSERSVVNYITRPIDFESRVYAAKRSKIKYSEMESFGKQALKDIDLHLRDADLKRKGVPVFLIYGWDHTTDVIDAAFGIPIIPDGEPKEVEIIRIESSKNAYAAAAVGNRSSAKDVHRSITKYFTSNGWDFEYPFIEEYIKGPLSDVEDEGKVTNVIYFKK